MKITFRHHGQHYQADLSQGTDLSSQLGDPGLELTAWGVPPVSIVPVMGDGWVGAVSQGSPVNFFDIAFNPHGNGTHTECFGHIAPEHQRVAVHISDFHQLCRLVVLSPEEINGDQVVSLASLQAKELEWDVEALIIKAGDYRPGHDFTGSNPVYFEPELLEFVREKGIRHFLTNLPSVDREEDGGRLLAHKAFWHYPDAPRDDAFITELLLIDEKLKEGLYLLNLQVAPFVNDASPSRPVIYPLTAE